MLQTTAFLAMAGLTARYMLPLVLDYLKNAAILTHIAALNGNFGFYHVESP